MRSATSYFNGTLYRKTLARYWPLWAGYGLIWLFMLPLNLLNRYFNHYGSTAARFRLFEAAVELPGAASFGLFLAVFFAILCAMAVFGYLYNSRSSCWFHALPMRREALFTTQYLAGLSFLILPQLAVAVLTAIIEIALLPVEHWGRTLGALLIWLLAQSGLVLFFFSFATFCAMFTGHILALPAFYGILNVLAETIYFLVDALMQSFFYGYAGSPGAQTAVAYLTPFYTLQGAIQLTWYDLGNQNLDGVLTSPGTVAAYAGVGVVFAIASLYVYRRRHAETAGDVVSIPVVRPLFKYGVSFCAGLCFGMFTAAFFGWNEMTFLIPCVLIWTVVGYFVAEMLLKKSFRVFKAWKGGAAMAGVMLLLCLVCAFDPFGVAAHVPGLGQVKSLTVYYDMGYPYDSGRDMHVTLTEPQQIQKFLDLHRAIADDRDRASYTSGNYEPGDDYIHLQLWYELEGGSRLNREYHSVPVYLEELEQEGSVTAIAQSLLNDQKLTAQSYGIDSFLKDRQLVSAWITGLTNSNSDRDYNSVYLDGYVKELWEAVRQDFDEGTLGVRYLFDASPEREANTYVTDLHFDALNNRSQTSISNETAPSSQSITITLTPQARNTLAVLEETGVFEEGYALMPYDSDDSKYPHTINY